MLTPFNYVTSATYAPPGELASASLGAAPITLTNAYNDRMQPILLSATTTSATLFSECFDFHLGVAVNTSPCSFCASTAGDNGNIYTIVNNRDNTRSQSFSYDVLNRITSGQSGGTQWGETYTIDAWGNLTNRAGIAGKTNYEPLSVSAGTNNQLSGFGYDAAGNMASNGTTTYTYDAENRLIATAGMSYIYDGEVCSVMPCCRHNSAVLNPASPCFRVAMICSSLCRVPFTVLSFPAQHVIAADIGSVTSLVRENLHSRWSGFRGLGQVDSSIFWAKNAGTY
jgi:hypothetical protein